MYLKIIYIATIFTLLLFGGVVFAASNEETDLEIEQRTNEMVSQSEEGLEEKYLADGTGYVDLKGRFQMFSKVKIIDGKQVFVCNTHPNINYKGHTHATVENKPNIKRSAK